MFKFQRAFTALLELVTQLTRKGEIRVDVELDKIADGRFYISVDISLHRQFFPEHRQISELLIHYPVGSDIFFEKAGRICRISVPTYRN